MLKRHLVILAAGLLGGLLALPVGQTAMLWHGQKQLNVYAQSVLERTQELARDAEHALTRLTQIDTDTCGERDLREMRYVLLQSNSISDIARVSHDVVECTALMGVLPVSAVLPPGGDQGLNGLQYWRHAHHFAEGRADMHMVRRDNTLLLISTASFDAIKSANPQLGALVVSQSNRFVFHELGNTTGLSAQLQADKSPEFFTSRLETLRCLPANGPCVVAALNGFNAMGENTLLWVTLILAGVATGVAAGFALWQRHQARCALPQQVRRGIDQGRLRAAYQPLVRVRDQRVVGFEVLARLNDEQGRPIPPDVFIAIAENDGLIGSVTRQIIQRALSELAPRMQADRALYVSINLSASDVTDPTLVAYLDAQAAQQDIAPEQVVLEITERSTADQMQLIHAMQVLRQRGYRFYIDDFGTGYSSLAYLSQLPISGIKIDRSFTHAIGTSAVGAAIVNRICEISGPLGIQVVVEGIETREQAQHVLTLNTEVLGQGWLFGKPLPAPQLAPAAMPQASAPQPPCMAPTA